MIIAKNDKDSINIDNAYSTANINTTSGIHTTLHSNNANNMKYAINFDTDPVLFTDDAATISGRINHNTDYLLLYNASPWVISRQ